MTYKNWSCYSNNENHEHERDQHDKYTHDH